MAPNQTAPRQDVELTDSTQGGWTLVAGIERDLKKMRRSIEAHYTRWTSLLFQPSRNQTDLLVGFRF